MSDLSSIGPGPTGSPSPINRAAAVHLNGAVKHSGAVESPSRFSDSSDHDRVELSSIARFMDQLRQLPSLPSDRIGQIRQSINDGTYDTPDKFDVAVERLIDDLQL